MEVDDEALYNAIQKWEEDASIKLLLDMGAYREHFLNEYGIELSLVGNRIVDEQKYMMFILRWS
jgi:hypothetical protein